MYFDNVATTKPFDEVLKQANIIASENYFNPSSSYRKGIQSYELLQKSREQVLQTLSPQGELIFCASATEANNLAIFGMARFKQKRYITTKVEHPSVYNCFLELEKNGYDVQYVNITKNGEIDYEHLESLLSVDVALLSVFHTNNESGVVNDLERVSSILRKHSKTAIFHSDGVQSFAKIPVNTMKLGVDMYTISGHKIGGLKGVGGLYTRKNLNLKPYLFGGGQERNLRSGTENLPAIATLRLAYDIMFAQRERIFELGDYLKTSLVSALNANAIPFKINGENAQKNILNISFLGIKAEVLMQQLSDENIFIARGSACSKNAPKSRLAVALNLTKTEADGQTRISVGAQTTRQQIDVLVQTIIEKTKRN